MGRYLWAMEAFTNPESVNMTMEMFALWKLAANDFLKDLKVLDRPWLRRFGVLPGLVRLLNPVTQGIAIQRGNTYTYKTEHYMLSTAQCHHAGEFGDQQHIWQATLNGGVTVFTTHPGAAFFEDNARNFSPSYWVGNGINPEAAQRKNVCLCLYKLDRRKGFMEKQRQMYTHAYFPQKKFDQVNRVHERLYVGRKGEGYIALFSLNPLEEAGEEELIQRGNTTGWAVVMGSGKDFVSLETFVQKMRRFKLYTFPQNGLALEDGRSHGDCWSLDCGCFKFDDLVLDMEYPRLSCPFGEVKRDPEEYAIRFGECSLRLNLAAGLREGDGI
jgi:hypothetical protein